MDRAVSRHMKLLGMISCLTGYGLGATLVVAAPAQEVYRYTSDAGTRQDHGGKETVSMTFAYTNDRVTLFSRTMAVDSSQTVAMILAPDGTVVSAALERVTSPGGEVVKRCRARKEDGTVVVDLARGRKISTRSIRVPEGRKFAMDASLLCLMRQFPFGTGEEWRVFMVDWSGHSVTVSVRNEGVENVTVPAGEFTCYRMEVRVGVAFLKATITYWLTEDPPHFLVKHTGRKGPFTRTYTTVLDSIETPALRAAGQPDRGR